MPNKIEVFEDKSGEWRWHKRAENGNIIADSGEGYENEEFAYKMAREEAEEGDIVEGVVADESSE